MTKSVLIILSLAAFSACTAEKILRAPTMTDEERAREQVENQRDVQLIQATGCRYAILYYEYERSVGRTSTFPEVSRKQYENDKQRYAELVGKYGFTDAQVDARRRQEEMLIEPESKALQKAASARAAERAAKVEPVKTVEAQGNPEGRNRVARVQWENARQTEARDPRAAERGRASARKLCPEIEKAMAIYDDGVTQIDLGNYDKAQTLMQSANAAAPGISDLITLEAIKKFADHRAKMRPPSRTR